MRRDQTVSDNTSSLSASLKRGGYLPSTEPPVAPAEIHMLDIWTALGGDAGTFHAWLRDDERRTPADSWAQLMAAVAGDRRLLEADTNPPAGLLLDLVPEARSNRDLRDFINHKRAAAYDQTGELLAARPVYDPRINDVFEIHAYEEASYQNERQFNLAMGYIQACDDIREAMRAGDAA